MKKYLWVIITLVGFQLIIVILIGLFNGYFYIHQNQKDITITGGRNIFRFGPILLKIDDEWILNNGKNNFIRIGFRKFDISTDDIVYKKMSPVSLAINNSSTTIIPEKTTEYPDFEIIYYDIPIKSNEIWIDLDLHVENLYSLDDYTIRSNIVDLKRFYFYHPMKKKWLGIHYTSGMSILLMDEDVYNSDFKSLKDFEEFLDNWGSKSEFDPDFKLNILDNRVMKIPSTEVYSKKMSNVLQKYGLLCWYVEKKVIAPKDDDE